MKTVSKYKLPAILFAVWLACFITFRVTGYPSGTKNTIWYECSGAITLGRCDGYFPAPLLWAIIALGVVAFIAMLITFARAISSKK